MLSKIKYLLHLVILSLLLIVFNSCTSKNAELTNLQLEKVYGEKSWDEVLKSEEKVFYFLAPECPLCQNYAVAMRKLQESYPEVEFIGIFPGEEYSKEEMRKYLIRFKLDMNCYLDPEFELTNMLEAEITPEAFLLDKHANILYGGAIDNWAISLGQKRSVVTEHYLSDAIQASLNNESIRTKKSKAVGCFIQ